MLTLNYNTGIKPTAAFTLFNQTLMFSIFRHLFSIHEYHYVAGGYRPHSGHTSVA
jgi:hypothetical protein